MEAKLCRGRVHEVLRRTIGTAALLVVVWALACASAAAELDESNLYYEDLTSANTAVERAEARLAASRTAIDEARAQKPAVQARVRFWNKLRDRRTDASLRARSRADQAQTAEQRRREAAARRDAEAKDQLAFATGVWQRSRGRAVSVMVLAVALALAVALFTATAHIRRRWPDGKPRSDGRSVGLLAVGLGGATAGLLTALAIGVWLVGAEGVVWWTAAAAVAALLLPLSVALGWRRADADAWPARVPAAAYKAAAVFVVVVWVSVALAARSDLGRAEPRMTPLPEETVALARAAAYEQPMPDDVQRLSERATRLERRAADSQSQIDGLSARLDELNSTAQRENDRIGALTRALQRRQNEQSSAQEDYDRWADLDARIRGGAGTDDVPYDSPYDDSGDLPDPSVPGYDPPTTEDFGDGEGSVGTCADGTLSDSIGRPGACSHHGGVAE